MEQLYSELDVFLNGLEFAVMAFCVMRFYTGILKSEEIKRIRFWIAFVYFLSSFLLYCIPVGMNGIFTYIAVGADLFTFLVICVIYRRDGILKIFVMVTFMALCNLKSALSNSLNASLIFFYAELESLGWSQEILLGICMWNYTLLDCVFLFVATEVIMKFLKKQRQPFSFSEAAFLLLPSISGMVGGFIINRYDDFLYIEEKRVWIFLSLAASSLIFFIMIVAMIILFQNMKDQKEAVFEGEVMKNQIEHITSHINKIEKIHERIRGMKHDLKNHLSSVEILLREGKTENALTYLEQFEHAMEVMEFPARTGNPVTDVILGEYESEAKRKGISWKAEFIYPNHTKIDEFDMSTILHNILENAFEACDRLEPEKRYVEIRSYRKKNVYFIEARNGRTGVCIWGDDGLPCSTKDMRGLHGMGLKNIQHVAEKYHGAMEIMLEEETFILRVMLLCVC